jgi:hypothetical protein
VKTIPRLAATIFAGAAALGVAGVGSAVDAQAQPGPFPQWCQVNFGTQVGVITGTGITAMTGAVGLGDRGRPVGLGDRALGDRRHPVDLGDLPKPFGDLRSQTRPACTDRQGAFS